MSQKHSVMITQFYVPPTNEPYLPTRATFIHDSNDTSSV